MKPESFALSPNPFYVLSASYSSSAFEISELVDEAQIGGHVNEADLHAAQQALVTPKLRLRAELGWLPELSPDQVEDIIERRASLSSTGLLASIHKFPSLARANLLADLCGRQTVDVEAINALIGAWAELDEKTIFDFIAIYRKKAGFPPVDWKNFLSALQEVKGAHSNAAATSLLRSGNPRQAMRKLTEAHTTDEFASSLLPALVREYESGNEVSYSRIAEQINNTIDKAKSQAVEPLTAIAKIKLLLGEWGELAEPVSPYYVSCGLIEPRSKAIFQSIRSYSLDLANDEGRYDLAKSLTSALVIGFSPYQDLANIAAKDIVAIDNLIAERRDFELFQPLYEACENAKSEYNRFSAAVRQKGLIIGSPAPVGPLIASLNDFISKNGNPNVAVAVLRDLALTSNNDHDDPEVSYLLTQLILTRFGEQLDGDTIEKLEEDAGTVFKNWKITALEKNAKNLSLMIQQLNEIVRVAPQSVRREFSYMLTHLTEKRRKKRMRWAWIVGLAAIFIVPAILSANKKTAPRYIPSNSTNTRTSTTPIDTSPVEDFQESIPPIGVGHTLSRGQVRYCIFQGRRLDILRSMTTTNSAVDKFNALVGDYNDRCARFSYRQTDMTSVQGEAAGRSLQFQAEAAGIARGW